MVPTKTKTWLMIPLIGSRKTYTPLKRKRNTLKTMKTKKKRKSKAMIKRRRKRQRRMRKRT